MNFEPLIPCPVEGCDALIDGARVDRCNECQSRGRTVSREQKSGVLSDGRGRADKEAATRTAERLKPAQPRAAKPKEKQ
jgi:hypothetical protein